MDLKGKVAICNDMKMGVICGQRKDRGEPYWYGIGFDGSNWQSKSPLVVSDSIYEFVERLISELVSASEIDDITDKLKTLNLI